MDSAIKNKFGAREAQLDAETENLKLLLQDPTLTISQTNRANAQIAKKEKEKAALDKKKEDSKKILDWAVEARQNGASALEAQEIANIGLSDNPDLNKAFGIYSKYAKEEEKVTGQSDFEQAFLRDTGRLPTVAELLDWKAKVGAAGRAPEEITVGTAEDFFTPTQLSAGADNANMSIEDFGNLSVDEANKYVRGEKAPAEPLTPEETIDEIVKILEPQKATFTRDEARDAAIRQMKEALGLKAGEELPKSYKNAIEDGLVKVYGRTFWQKILPGGR